LKRLKTDWLDLYLLHWPSRYPIKETMRALEALVAAGQTRLIGVSNFSVTQMRAAQAALRNERVACNQVQYHLGARGIERQLLPYCAAHQIAVVGYSPFVHGNFLSRSTADRSILDELVRFGELFQWNVLAEVGERHQRTPRQVALNFLTRHPSLFTIPKASTIEHVRENAGGVGWSLSDYDIAAIDRAFPTPSAIQHWMRRATRKAMRSLTRIFP
jgi:diketogulonate reductase-like aldo/keto reductase